MTQHPAAQEGEGRERTARAGTTDSGVETGLSPRQERLLLPVLTLVGLLISLIGSVGAPLVPTLARSYHISESTAQWSLTITLMSGAVSTPLLTRLGDGPHRRAVLFAGLMAAVVGGALAAIPGSFALLVVGRALQGAANGLLPIAMSIVRDHLPAERARRAVAVLSVTAAAGVGLGYPVTGLIAKYLSFHIGYIMVAGFAALAAALAAVVVPSDSDRPRRRIDPRGAVLLVVGFGAFMLALSEGVAWGWASVRVLGLFAAALVLLTGWVWQERRTAHPVVDLRIMGDRAVLAGNLTAVLAGIGMYLLLSLVVRFVQTPRSSGYGLGETVLVAGFVLIPFSVLSVVSSRVAARIEDWLGFRPVIPIGCIVFVTAMLAFRFARGSLWEVCLVMGIAGLGSGCVFAAMPRLILRSVPAAQSSSALGVNQVMRFIGFSIGSALSATILSAFTHGGLGLPRVGGYDIAALTGAGVWLTAGIVAYVVPGGARPDTASSLATAGSAVGPGPVAAVVPDPAAAVVPAPVGGSSDRHDAEQDGADV